MGILQRASVPADAREALVTPPWPPWAQVVAVFVLAVAAAIVWVRA
jgi:membrane protein implicated in regulation of membrane protease activity